MDRIDTITDGAPRRRRATRFEASVLSLVVSLAALAAAVTVHAEPGGDLVLPEPDRSITVPPLTLHDDVDPTRCSVPIPVGNGVRGTLHGSVDGVVVEPMVYLYDNPLRSAVRGMVPAGSVVEVLMVRPDPVMRYYLVRLRAADGRSVEGWVPALLIEVHEPERER